MKKILRISVRKWRILALFANGEIRYKISNPVSFEIKRIIFGGVLFYYSCGFYSSRYFCDNVLFTTYITLRYKNVCFEHYCKCTYLLYY